jgi:regulatory protein
MKITSIIKKGARDVEIHFENDEKLILAVDVFLKSGLIKFDDISDDRFFLLIEKNKKYHIKNRAFRLLGRRHHSTSELKQKLWQKDYDKKLIDAVVEELVAANYLNDKEFAEQFAEEKLSTKLWSEKKIRSELIRKGIHSSIISEVISEKINEEENQGNAYRVASIKYESLVKRNLEPAEVKIKLSAFLNTRGFNCETIRSVCDKLIRENSI